ncbi:MAG TPA: hypothetical protein VFA41_20870 [Ktedonobacteraceae bacterium]|nr:hypothetical protein [Ktedonobacteraceae bacterium]
MITNEGDAYHFIHKSFHEYLVAKHIFEQMRHKENAKEEVAKVLQFFLPVEIVTFLKDMLNGKDFSRHEQALTVDTLIKVYQLHDRNDHRSATIRQNACSYLSYLGTQKASQFLEKTYRQEPNKWVQRGMMLGLALSCYRQDILEEYIEMLRNDPEAASINIGYHLAYYGDQAPSEGFRDRGGERCEATVRSIFRHLHSERYRNGWVLDLLTLRTLLEQRGVIAFSSNEQHLPFLAEFLNRNHLEQSNIFQEERQLLFTALKGVALL